MPAGAGAVATTAQAKLRESVSVWDFGVLPTNADNLALLNAAIANVPAGTALFFPPGTYNISSYVSVLRSDISLICGIGVVINNTNVSTGYLSDGIRVGNMALIEAEGGTNTIPYAYVSNILIDGFTFTNCRIGLWFVYAKNFTAKNIQANATAVVACGNDAYDDCFNFKLENITQLSWDLRKGSQDFYIIGIYRCQQFEVNGVYQLEGMSGPANAAAIDINESQFFSVENAHIDQETKTSNGISIIGCQYFSVDDTNTVVRANNGFTTFPRNGVVNLFGTVSGIAVNCTTGLSVSTSYTTFKDVVTKGCTTDLYLGTDATVNWFEYCKLNPDGTATIVEQVSGGNNGINLQRWRNCKTGNTPLGIEGVTDGYFGGAKPAFAASQITALAAATGDGTFVTIPAFITEEYDQHNDFNLATGTFTAPIDGMYQFQVGVGSPAAHGDMTAYLLVAGTSVFVSAVVGLPNTNPAWTDGTKTLRLTRGQTVRLQAVAYGGAKDVAIQAYAAQVYFSGRLA